MHYVKHFNNMLSSRWRWRKGQFVDQEMKNVKIVLGKEKVKFIIIFFSSVIEKLIYLSFELT